MSGSLATASTAVSAERKRSLLLEARRDRVAWVDAASVPFRSALDGSNDVATRERFGRGDEGFEVLRSARAFASMPSAVDVAKTLYSAPTIPSQDAADRIKWLLESEIRADDLQMAMMSTNSLKSDQKDIGSSALSGSESDKAGEKKEDKQRGESEIFRKHDDKVFISSYCEFLHRLRSPECAELVRAMRRFVNSFDDFARGAAERTRSSGEKKKDEDVKRLASMIHGNISKSFDAFKSHPKWGATIDSNEKESSKEAVLLSADLKQSIDTFLFAKCHKAIWACVHDEVSINEDIAFQGRLDDLQFVTPKHLDIHCFIEDVNGGVSEAEKTEGEKGASEDSEPEKKAGEVIKVMPWLEQLSVPIRSLQSVESQYSPSRMLSCIHDVYRGINEALSAAMVSAEESGTTLPSADDVLPVLILVVLQAQPRHIVSNLNFVELFATPEQLRGEVGYAFTNLFSAVQFLRDLDIEKYLKKEDKEDEDTNRRVSFFSMSPDEFKLGLEKCRQDTKERSEDKIRLESSSDQTAADSESLLLSQVDICIPVDTIHSARSKGEVIDIGWACKWQNQNRRHLYTPEVKTAENDFSKEQHQGDYSLDLLPLPDGFSRSYSFLSLEPEDVRITQVPQLLHEYQKLVRATEFLLSDRNARFVADHKEQARLTRDKLERAVKEVDG
eukprot:CAMPEP_0197443922 /NCGR_PEP_ID=MMETSP1175-20131217/9543_1 /TAXON_ID=1003142 /ORGANISM="Triceratium dubium, Strain CCMP147" /LENGTH=671 /DNA_ID=CAMNT_0042974631 /DNA_START=236 /DNA_END=2251 /DNA_ORIENTATION=+